MAKQQKPYVEVSTDTSATEVSLVPQLKERVSDVEALTRTVLLLAVITVAGIVVSAVTLFIDQAHYNASEYKQGYDEQRQQEDTEYQVRTLQHELQTQKAPIPSPSNPPQ